MRTRRSMPVLAVASRHNPRPRPLLRVFMILAMHLWELAARPVPYSLSLHPQPVAATTGAS